MFKVFEPVAIVNYGSMTGVTGTVVGVANVDEDVYIVELDSWKVVSKWPCICVPEKHMDPLV